MGKVKEEKPQQEGTIQDLFTEQKAQTPDDNSFTPTEPLEFSQEAQAVLNAGRELWRYYHKGHKEWKGPNELHQRGCNL